MMSTRALQAKGKIDIHNGWRYRGLYPKAVWSFNDVGFKVEVGEKVSKMMVGVTTSLVKAYGHHLRPEVFA